MAVAVDPLAFLDDWTRTQVPVKQTGVRLNGDWVKMACEGCGRSFDMKARAYRSYLVGQRSSLCRYCDTRKGIPRPIVKNEHCLFWLNEYTSEEIKDLAEACWGQREFWSPEWREDFEFCHTVKPGFRGKFSGTLVNPA